MGDIIERPPIGIIDGFSHSEGEWFIALWDYLQTLTWKGTGATTSNEALDLLHTPAKNEKAFIAHAEITMARTALVSAHGYYTLVGYGYCTGGVVTATSVVLGSYEPDAAASAAIMGSGGNIMVRVTGVAGVPYNWGASLRVTYNK